MDELMNEFDVQADDGQTFHIREFRNVIDAGHMLDAGKRVYGKLARFETSEGHAVNKIDEQTFEIVSTGQKARTIP